MRKILSKTKKDYNIIASHFSEKRKFFWRELRPFLSFVKVKNKVLDVGCGNGRLYRELKDKKIDYLGIDFSKKMLEIAKKNNPGAKFRLGDLTKEEAWQGLKDFDICFCLAVLHHFPTPREQLKVLKNAYKALKNNGLLVISVWNLWQKRFWGLHFKQLPWKVINGFKFKWLLISYKVSDGRKVIKKVDRFYYCFGRKELEKIVKKTGFIIIKRKIGKNLCLVAKKIV